MYNHLKNIENLYGKAYVQIPNKIFKNLISSILRGNKSNIRQVSFAYTYIVTVSLLYKYAHFVDVDNKTYIQNSDIKLMLKYGKSTKSIDSIIKKDGLLEGVGLIKTTNDFPVGVRYSKEKINGKNIRYFITIKELDVNSSSYNMIKEIVKNRNYVVKEPLFFFEYDDEIGSLYNYDNTHRITLDEFIRFVFDDNMDNIDFLIYAYLKSKCNGMKNNTKSIPLDRISAELGISKSAFYDHLDKLKDKNLVIVSHKEWKSLHNNNGKSVEANEYTFVGVK